MIKIYKIFIILTFLIVLICHVVGTIFGSQIIKILKMEITIIYSIIIGIKLEKNNYLHNKRRFNFFFFLRKKKKKKHERTLSDEIISSQPRKYRKF